jgi:hypothetical protein
MSDDHPPLCSCRPCKILRKLDPSFIDPYARPRRPDGTYLPADRSPRPCPTCGSIYIPVSIHHTRCSENCREDIPMNIHHTEGTDNV